MIVTLTITSFLLSPSLWALSCSSLVERIIVECKSESCERGFYVNEIPVSPACNRRPVVLPASDWQIKIAQEFAKASVDKQFKVGTYELTFNKQIYGEEATASAADFIGPNIQYMVWSSRGSQMPEKLKLFNQTHDPKLLSDAEFLRQLNDEWKSFSGRSLVVSLSDPYEKIFNVWETSEREKLEQFQKRQYLDQALFWLAAIILGCTIYFFFRNTRRFFMGRTQNLNIALPLLIQSVFLAYLIYKIIFFNGGSSWSFTRVAAYVLIAGVFEFPYFMYQRMKFRKAKVNRS